MDILEFLQTVALVLLLVWIIILKRDVERAFRFLADEIRKLKKVK